MANRVDEFATKRTDAQFNLVDIADQDLPLVDKPVLPSAGQHSKEHTGAWGRDGCHLSL